jgi:hypothetical protein
MKTLCILSLFFVSFSQSGHSAIRYVTVAGGLAMDGSNWANAYPGNSLQVAIDASAPGDEVWVAAGTYKTTAGIDRSISFVMKNGVTIYGSFAGTETTLSQRILTNGLTTILSGEIGVAGIGDNSYHTISNTGLNNTAVIDGFIIRDANDNRTPTVTDGLGGGIYNNGSGAGNSCNPTIRNCVITNNQAVFGAGIFNSGYNGGVSTPLISNCVIANNIATTGGGGIDNFGVLGNASPVITNCVIYNNTAVERAGGMYCWGGTNGNANPIVLNTVFANNSAIDGGAVVSDRLNASGIGSSGNSNPNFRNCIFRGNTASGTGPQFFILGGATFTATYTAIDLVGQTSPHTVSGAGTGNTTVDPSFINIGLGAGPDGNWITADDGLQLSGVSSACYNSGNNTGVPAIDILSNNRIALGTADMGPYELNSFPLPVQPGNFFATSIGGKNHLYWTTINERNNSFFEIERSNDASNFTKIGLQSGSMNSNTITHYTFTDNYPQHGMNYYRLKQTDIDGEYSYSKIVSLANHIEGNIIFYPNPTKGLISISGLSLSQYSVKIISSTGMTLKLIRNNPVLLDLSDLPNAVYIISIETGNKTITRQIIKE